MKIAYIGNFGPQYSTENDLKDGFEALEHTVIPLQENKVSIEEVTKVALESDMLLITGTWDDALDLKQMITLFKQLADKGIPSVTYHLDTFWGTSRGGRQWWLHPMFHTTYIFTADGDYQQKWGMFGKFHQHMFPGVRHIYAKKGRLRDKYKCDVAFVGSNGIGYHEDVWGYRKELIDNLKRICKKNNWTFKNPGGDDPKIERNMDMNDFYASAKITVGDSLCLKKEDSRYFSDRVMEAWGRGGFLIMPKINLLNLIFRRHQPFYRWHDWGDLEKQIKHHMDNPKDARRTADFNHVLVKENHTYLDRAEEIIKKVYGTN